MNERDQKICALYEQGLLLKTIAERMGLAPNSIGGILKKHGYTRPGKPQKAVKLPADIETKVRDLWAAGQNCAQIAERYNVAIDTISQIASKLGLLDPKNPRHRYDGIGGIGKTGRGSKNAFARIASRT